MTGRGKKRPQAPSSPAGAFEAAVSLLSYKENTERELRRKLKERGFEDAHIDEAFVKLREKRYLDETRYFLRYVRILAEVRHYGANRILKEAFAKGFSRETIKEHAKDALAGFDFSALCLEVLRALPQRNDDRKAAAALFRRGYSDAEIREAIRAAKMDRDP